MTNHNTTHSQIVDMSSERSFQTFPYLPLVLVDEVLTCFCSGFETSDHILQPNMDNFVQIDRLVSIQGERFRCQLFQCALYRFGSAIIVTPINIISFSYGIHSSSCLSTSSVASRKLAAVFISLCRKRMTQNRSLGVITVYTS